MLIRLQAAGEIDPALSLETCRTAMVCTTAGGLVALTCGAGGCYTPPDLPAQLRATLRSVGLLTRDPRMKERKKPGQKAARRRFQFSKR